MKKSLTSLIPTIIFLSAGCTLFNPYGEYNIKDTSATRYSLSINRKTTEKGTYYSFRSMDNNETIGLYDIDSDGTLDRVEKSTIEDTKRYEVPRGSREFIFWNKEFRKIKGNAKSLSFPKPTKSKHRDTRPRIV